MLQQWRDAAPVLATTTAPTPAQASPAAEWHPDGTANRMPLSAVTMRYLAAHETKHKLHQQYLVLRSQEQWQQLCPSIGENVNPNASIKEGMKRNLMHPDTINELNAKLKEIIDYLMIFIHSNNTEKNDKERDLNSSFINLLQRPLLYSHAPHFYYPYEHQSILVTWLQAFLVDLLGSTTNAATFDSFDMDLPNTATQLHTFHSRTEEYALQSKEWKTQLQETFAQLCERNEVLNKIKKDIDALVTRKG